MEYIDLEPKWEELCRAFSKFDPIILELMGACKTADIVRQAQKSGAKSVTFIFLADKEIDVQIETA
jgi:hypothetical protein